MRADEFQVALARGAGHDWSPYLEGVTGSIRKALLAELSVIELSHRWESGEQPTVEEYLERFPELESAPATLLEEYENCRNRAGLSAMATQRSRVLPTPLERVVPATPDTEEDDPLLRATRTVASTGGPRPVVPGTHGDGLLGVAQNYDLISELGRGAYGEVWLARKTTSGIEKAVKILHKPADDESGQAELASLELIKNLRHPFLLSTEDFWIANNKLYIVTELADGSLRKKLIESKGNNPPGLSEDELFRFTLEAAEGFDYLHSKKVTHRDVKPDNILLVNGHVKIADFGLARQHTDVVTLMSFAGTPAYMAPEVWGCEGGPPSDQYGFAMSYVELRQGRLPFKLGKVTEMMQVHQNGQFDFADHIGEAERAVLQRALAKDPIDRYPSCLAFAEELAEAAGRNIRRRTEPVPPPRPEYYESLRGSPPPVGKSSRTWILAVIALVFAGLSFAAVMFKKPDHTNQDGGAPSAVVVPIGSEAVDDSPTVNLADGRGVKEFVVVRRGDHAVRFRLIAPTAVGGEPIAPFFLSQSKVWNSLFGGEPRADQGGPDAPATNITANQAAEFAASLGGRLPSPDEWDHAAGFFNPEGKLPVRDGGEARVGLKLPVATHGETARRTENQNDIMDVAGNGREWTRMAYPSTVVNGPQFLPKQLIVLRGRNFTLEKPLTFEVMNRERTQPQTQFADVPSPYTGFRIVLPLPE
jgi:serine/threonine protein kinase